MIDADAISRMRTEAILINVGRGGLVDESALLRALKEGRISGAALDVFAVEPLPPDSALWGLPNVLVSPHTAALSVHENERITVLFIENLRHYLAGEELVSIVHSEFFY
jgi:phosphoglycerate dehydrogenase-like enzyme